MRLNVEAVEPSHIGLWVFTEDHACAHESCHLPHLEVIPGNDRAPAAGVVTEEEQVIQGEDAVFLENSRGC